MMRFIENQKEVIDTLRNPKSHSATERKRAYLFLCVYIIGFLGVVCNAFHFISGWIGLLLIQFVQTIFSIMYVFNITDYSEKQATAMECERACNPILDAYMAVRVIQLLLSLWLRSVVAFPLFLIAFGLHIWRVKKGHQYIDATNLWRDIRKNERETYINCAVDIVLIIAVMVAMVFAIITKYG